MFWVYFHESVKYSLPSEEIPVFWDHLSEMHNLFCHVSAYHLRCLWGWDSYVVSGYLCRRMQCFNRQKQCLTSLWGKVKLQLHSLCVKCYTPRQLRMPFPAIGHTSAEQSHLLRDFSIIIQYIHYTIFRNHYTSMQVSWATQTKFLSTRHRTLPARRGTMDKFAMPDTSTHDHYWESRTVPFDLESCSLFTIYKT